MKVCPQCGKKYGDDWGICINDDSKLVKEGDIIIPISPATLKTTTNECPFCKSEIKKGASRCPYCREALGVTGTLDNVAKVCNQAAKVGFSLFWLFLFLSIFGIPLLISLLANHK